MKIQELAIIFIIIILPISLILSVYTQSQIQTLNTQTLYDAKLTAASFDAIKAFQLNTANSTISNLANSKIRELEASINTFKTSIASAFGMNGISEEELNEYVPALVYTIYDGFYVYSPYTNKNDLGINNDSEEIYGLQPYIPYSCQYKWEGNDVIITYSLDNYISIKGMINGKYITDEGYLVGGITEDAATGKIIYKGVEIEKETELKENIAGVEYPYRKINGTKYYYDNGGEIPGEENNIYNDEIFILLNGERITQKSGEKAAQYYHTVIKNNTSALQYYKEAMEFTKRVENYGLSSITYQNAYDPSTGDKIWSNNASPIFAKNSGNLEIDENIEYELSNFTSHKLSVIRYVIEKNLSEVIANYNSYSITAGIDFQMPELTETEWDNVIKNISLISFVQGIPIGGKIYNGYTIVNNTESKEVVKEEDIYIIGDDKYYHKIGDIYLDDISNIDSSIPAGRIKLDFKRTFVLDDDNESKYYYPREEYASYNSVVTQNCDSVNTYDDIYEYIQDSENLLKETFYTALGREREGSYKLFNADDYEHDILIIGKASKQNELKAITDYINNNNPTEIKMKARYKCNPTSSYLNEQKENYSLIIIDAIEDDVADLISISDLNNLANYTNIMTIGAKNKLDNFATSSGSKTETDGITLKTTATTFGEYEVSNIEDRVLSRVNWSNFNEQVKVLCKTQYIENGRIEEHDSIGYLKNGNYGWMNSQVSLGEKESDYKVISELAELTINGITEGTTRILLAALGNSMGDEEYVKSINDRLNTNSNIESNYIFSLNNDNIKDKIKRTAVNYDLIIIDTFDNDLPIETINYIRNYVTRKPNIITISSKTSTHLGIVQASEVLAAASSITPEFTSLGHQYLNKMGDVGIAQTEMTSKVTFQSRAKILCEDSSSRNDLIAYLEEASGLVWIHSAINIKRGSESNNTSGEKVIEQLAQLAIHRQDGCTVVFDSNGGESVQAIRGFENEIIKLPSCNKIGGRFLYWTDISSPGSQYLAGSDYTITEQSVVLKAVWDESMYTITFDPNGGEVTPTYMTGGYGEKRTLPKPVAREGYYFNGWLKEGATEHYMDGVEYEITANETLVADWTPIIYRITLDPNGGEVTPNTIEATYKKWIDLPTPIKAGYDFKGWRVGNNIYPAGENVYQVTASRDDVKAEWEKSKYIITFDTKGGNDIEPIEGREGTEIRLPKPSKTNCEFVEWVSLNTGDTYSAGEYYVIEKSDKLTAKWLKMETITISNWRISVRDYGGFGWNDHRGEGRMSVELPKGAKYIKIESIGMSVSSFCSCCLSQNNMSISINDKEIITGDCNYPYQPNSDSWTRTVPTGKIELNESPSYLNLLAEVTNKVIFNMKYTVYIPE